ncbi:hypothetical protein, partial [Escherichia coli]|uniref:hypothetical protein n=1 Tax=Escherichia coli TaxID=562 RepID=UPI0039A5C653
STTEPKSTRIKQIKTNKKEAVTSERKKRAEHLKPSSSGDEAKVIPFNAVEADDQEDYSLPTYVLWSNLNGHFDRVFSPRQGT